MPNKMTNFFRKATSFFRSKKATNAQPIASQKPTVAALDRTRDKLFQTELDAAKRRFVPSFEEKTIRGNPIQRLIELYSQKEKLLATALQKTDFSKELPKELIEALSKKVAISLIATLEPEKRRAMIASELQRAGRRVKYLNGAINSKNQAEFEEWLVRIYRDEPQ